jgi:hypothetical protein
LVLGTFARRPELPGGSIELTFETRIPSPRAQNDAPAWHPFLFRIGIAFGCQKVRLRAHFNGGCSKTMSLRLRPALACLMSVSIAACSSPKDGALVVENGTDAAGNGSNGEGNGTGGGTDSDIGLDGDGNGSGDGNGGWDGSACTSQGVGAKLDPVYLVFLLDQSGSMGDGQHGNRKQKWDPVTAALNSFFEDSDSAGLYASLTLFPKNRNTGTGAADDKIGADCEASAYVEPEVKPTLLPNDTAFAAAIAAVDPPNEFGTPTRPALAGTIQYAESLLAQDASRRVVIVMVTDGVPVSCAGNNITNTANEAEAVADRIPTYVIGVGKELSNLNAIAQAGKTEEAFLVAVDDPTKTRTALLEQINSIRGEVISCEVPMPKPPAGRQLDPDKVYVEYSSSSGTVNLDYNPKCTGGTGWHYDSADKPTQVELCERTCATVKAQRTAGVNVVFGCVTRSDIR